MPGVINRKIPWTIQPQYPVGIDWSNALGRSVVEAFLPLFVNNQTTVRGYSPAVAAGTIVSEVGTLGRNVALAAGTLNAGLIIAADGDDIFPTTNEATIFVIRRSKDTTARQSTLFGYDVSATDRVLVHGPWDDGIMYFDYGGIAASQRISVAYTKSTAVEYLVFVAGGGKGREMWRNGVKIAGDATKAGARSATAANFRIGASSPTLAADTEEVYLFGTANRAWSDVEIASWSKNPWQIFRPLSRNIFVGGNLSASLFTDPDTFYSATLQSSTPLSPTLFTDADTFYSAVLSADGALQALTASLFTDPDTFYAAALQSSITLSPALYTDLDAFYGASVSASIGLSPALFTDADTFYAHTATAGAVTLSPALFTDPDTFYAATLLQASPQTLTASLFVDPDTFYSTADNTANTFSQEVAFRRFYMRKGKKLLMFDSVSEAEAYAKAETIADEAIAKAQKTSRLARKRIRTRILADTLPAQTIDTDWLAEMMQRFAMNADLPALLAEQEYNKVMEIYALAKAALDEEDDIEMLLMWG